MRRPTDHAALRAAGDFAELGVAPGAAAHFHLSPLDPGLRARVVRLDRKAESESTDGPAARTDAPLTVQDLDIGSWLAIVPPDSFPSSDWAIELEFRLAEMPSTGVL